ncbi:MAG: sigma-54-dependent transcriptional regulator [Syntrophobacteraceae bacterium]
MKILVVDDEHVALGSIKLLLKRRGIRDVSTCDNGREAIELIKNGDFDIVLLDLLIPGIDGFHILEATKPFKPNIEFIILTAVDEIASAVKSIRFGAYDYLVKPVDNDRLLLAIERAYERRALRAGLAGSGAHLSKLKVPEAFSAIITQNSRMIELLTYTQIMAGSNNPILITGESGTGKELVARGIHRAGPAADKPFVAVNVSAIPETLFESEIFGHCKGAFTGASAEHRGLFQQANGGTLFLDEIGELPLRLQPKLLRVIEEQTVMPIGSTRSIPVNVRIVSATTIDVDMALKEGKFRLDLMCRLKSVHVHLPPLRERDGDIPLLASHFLKQSNERYHKEIRGFSPAALELLLHRELPGNIRSLAHEVDKAVLLADSELIQPHHLGGRRPPAPLNMRSLCSLQEDHYRHVAYVLGSSRGDTNQAAEILGITVRQVQRILSRIRKDPHYRALLTDI